MNTERISAPARWPLNGLPSERPAFRVEALPFNGANSEYSPVPMGKDLLLITSDRAAATGDDTYQWTGQGFSDLFVVNLQDNSVSPLAGAVNTEANEGTPALSADGNTLYFTRCDAPKGEDAYCRIMRSERQSDGNWGTPNYLPFQQAGANYMHPALSADGQTLYFSAQLEDGWGGYDLYSVPIVNGAWGEPVILGRAINTPADEQFPQLDQDTLYFASSGTREWEDWMYFVRRNWHRVIGHLLSI
ncbi:MAG: hypothetical protein R2795_24580 [Saprospiraceae bacterium]